MGIKQQRTFLIIGSFLPSLFVVGICLLPLKVLLQTVWSQEKYSTSLDLNFFGCKMNNLDGLIARSLQGHFFFAKI